MHISSLWGEYSSGSFGKEAFQFIDFLKESGFTYWQTLPFGIPDKNNSPYTSYSSFGGNFYFVDLEIQDDEGLAFGYIAKKSEGTWVVLVNAKMKSIEINTSVSLNNGVIYIDSRSANKNGIENPVGVKISGKTVTLDPLTATVIRIK